MRKSNTSEWVSFAILMTLAIGSMVWYSYRIPVQEPHRVSYSSYV